MKKGPAPTEIRASSAPVAALKTYTESCDVLDADKSASLTHTLVPSGLTVTLVGFHEDGAGAPTPGGDRSPTTANVAVSMTLTDGPGDSDNGE
jgi:hypothetical protein